MHRTKKVLEIFIDVSECPHGTLDSLLADAAMACKGRLEEAEKQGPLELHDFGYSIHGGSDEEQAVVSAEIWGVTAEELDDIVHDAAANHAASFNNGTVEDQVRFLCRQLGGAGVIKYMKEIVNKR